MMQTTRIRIDGFIVGQIWWPTGAECFKDFSLDVLRERSRYTSKPSLRDLIVSASADGDFQSASLAACEVTITMHDTTKHGRRVSRSWPLSKFASGADCYHEAGDDWCPSCSDDEEEA